MPSSALEVGSCTNHLGRGQLPPGGGSDRHAFSWIESTQRPGRLCCPPQARPHRYPLFFSPLASLSPTSAPLLYIRHFLHPFSNFQTTPQGMEVFFMPLRVIKIQIHNLPPELRRIKSNHPLPPREVVTPGKFSRGRRVGEVTRGSVSDRTCHPRSCQGSCPTEVVTPVVVRWSCPTEVVTPEVVRVSCVMEIVTPKVVWGPVRPKLSPPKLSGGPV